VQRSARRRRLDDLLGREREEEDHADVVDEELEPVGDGVIAAGGGIRPDQGDQSAERQDERVLEREGNEPPA
jgi:hypothetical protein